MPPKGWKSVNIQEPSYNHFKTQYEKKKDEYRIKYGITSFSGFVGRSINEMLENYEKREQEFKKLEEEKEQLEAQIKELSKRR